MKIKRENFTIIDNDILLNSEISNSAKLLYIILVQHTFGKTYCYPSQKRLADIMGLKSTKQIRNLLSELKKFKLIITKREGFNRPNIYYIVRELERERKGISYHSGMELPLARGNKLPTNNTNIKRKDNNYAKGIESVGEILKKRDLSKARFEGNTVFL